MTSKQRYQTPSRASSSAQSTHTHRFTQSSSLFARSATDSHVFSTPNQRRATPNYPDLSSRGQPRSSSRTSTANIISPYQSSPQLPPHPQRQRLSLRPPSSRLSSNNSVPLQGNNDNSTLEDALSSEDADALGEVIMAIDMKDNGNLGCAYYIAIDETMFLLEDVAMSGIDLVETLLLHVNPTTILISARASEALASYLSKRVQGVDGNRGDSRSAFILRNLNSTDFRYDVGKTKLLALNLEALGHQSVLYTSIVDEVVDDADGFGEENSKQARLMRLGTSINLDSRLTIGCAGALLGDLQRRRTAHYLPNDPDSLVAFRIKSIEMFTLFDSMFVNADTLVSLQILQSEHHPNSHQRGPSTSGSKESLSVYGLFQHLARTPQGKLKLRQIFLRPSTDINVIHTRQKTISFLLRPGNAETLIQLSNELKKIKNMKSVVALLEKGVDIPGRKISIANNVWASLQRFAAYSLRLRDSLRTLPGSEKVEIVRKVIDVIQPLVLCQVGEFISQTIDFEQSMERGRTAVRLGVDANLDEMKRSYDGMEHFLTNVIAKLRDELPEWARRYVQNCIFFPQLGFLTVVSVNPETGKGNYDGEGLNDVWERMFTAEGCVYYKNRQMKEMDEHFGDAYCMIIDREIEIIHELAIKVLAQKEVIIAASDVLGELDSLFALAIGCGQYNWVAPKMTAQNIIHIRGGRHPLQELVVPSFIANDCCISGGPGPEEDEDDGAANENSSEVERNSIEHPSTLVLTGPNHSGKSVYLKQVALIVYLAHIGCFVPAERAQIGITDCILTRIATRESVARNESAFSIDLRQVAFAMNFATRRSLVLIDEFGKGTNSLDGAGLVTAVLDHFTSLGPERPKVLAATHFHEIFEGQFLVDTPELSFGHMDVRLDFDAPIMEDQVTYLFQLKSGRSIASFGSRCAAMNGIGEAVVERAESIMLLLARNEDLEVACSKLSDSETQKLEEAEVVARNFLGQDIRTPPSNGINVQGTQYRQILDQISSFDDSTAKY
ncbi:muts domain V-domain-containing protein [Annulohypoxylon maeteangense]|uniref:muts domain V-domain-containing protein n=1 Tax=Annulohypoxylon maeteangense TaxID=1927788 RepID=UPI0020085C2C|nr:muts domain V-domain-containing protein [Annulohypoxylon maeteangense]KAI0882714.1 muts domain V-domain-containing protein [Annulohypoxylon maeteangense]